MKAIESRAALAAAVALACICLVWTAGAAQPAVIVTTPGPEMATVPVTPTIQPSLSAPSPTQPPAAPAPTAPAAGPLTLVLDMPRSPALWGDVVRCTGVGAGDATVRILVDGVEAGRASPGAGGAYQFDYTIDRVSTGAHVVSAEAGSGAAAEASLEVAPTVPLVLLDAVPSVRENESALLCTGNVTASGKGVPNAPVHLVFDNYGWADATTGPEGQFEVNAGIRGGKHEVVANVSFADGRPLGPAASNVVTAVVPGGSPLPSWALPAAAVLAVLLLAAGGYRLLRRRSRRKRAPEAPAGDADLTARFQPGPPAAATAAAEETVAAPPPAPPVEEPPVPTPPATPTVEIVPPAEAAPGAAGTGDLRAAAWALAGNGMRCGIGAVYGDLVAKLAANEPEAHLEGMTPRQLAAHFAGTPAGVAVARITACYEAVTGTWRPPTPADLETMVEAYVAALAQTARSGQ